MFARVTAIAFNTFTELVRQKVFYILLIFGLCAIGGSILGAQVAFDAQFQMLKDTCLGAMSIFTTLLAILATANFIPKDTEDRTIYTLLAKPVPRYAYLLGKLLGIIGLLFLFVVLMSAVFCLVLWLRERAVIAGIPTEGASAEEINLAIREVTSQTFNFNLIPGILIIFVKSALLASLTLFISTFSTSFLFTVMSAAAVFFIGHLQATAREAWMQGIDPTVWTRLLVGIVALLFPDLQAFSLSDDVIAGAAIPLGIFFKTFMLGWVYVVIYFALAGFVFAGREL